MSGGKTMEHGASTSSAIANAQETDYLAGRSHNCKLSHLLSFTFSLGSLPKGDRTAFLPLVCEE